MGNIVLIGFQGVGKSFLGRKLAREWEMDFVDTDEEIKKEFENRCSMREIHIDLGEKKFRELEKRIVERVLGVKNTVIATGGGVVESTDMGALLKRLGRVVYLYNDLEVLQKRWKRPGSFLKGKNVNEFFLKGKDVEAFFERRAKMYGEVCDEKVEGTWDQILSVGSLR